MEPENYFDGQLGLDICRKCKTVLIDGVNWANNRKAGENHICKSCTSEYNAEYRRKNREHVRALCRAHAYKKGGRPMSENKECASYLGCHVAERVLSKTFKDVEVMRHGNPGYDFICNKGKKIDVKASCIRVNRNALEHWAFGINRNGIADYFLCIAFDNRKNLNPLHMWLLPADKINNICYATIRDENIDKWDNYRLCLDEVIEQCDAIKGDNR
jgi:hypothetical protein